MRWQLLQPALRLSKAASNSARLLSVIAFSKALIGLPTCFSLYGTYPDVPLGETGNTRNSPKDSERNDPDCASGNIKTADQFLKCYGITGPEKDGSRGGNQPPP